MERVRAAQAADQAAVGVGQGRAGDVPDTTITRGRPPARQRRQAQSPPAHDDLGPQEPARRLLKARPPPTASPPTSHDANLTATRSRPPPVLMPKNHTWTTRHPTRA